MSLGESEVFEGDRPSLGSEGLETFERGAGEGGRFGISRSTIGTVGNRRNRSGNEAGTGFAGRGRLQAGWEEREDHGRSSSCHERQDHNRQGKSDFGGDGARGSSFD